MSDESNNDAGSAKKAAKKATKNTAKKVGATPAATDQVTPPASAAATPAPPTEDKRGADRPRGKKVALIDGTRPFLIKHLQNWWSESDAEKRVDEIIEAVQSGAPVYLLCEGGAAPVLRVDQDLDYGDRDVVKSIAAAHGQNLLAMFNQILAGRGFVVS